MGTENSHKEPCWENKVDDLGLKYRFDKTLVDDILVRGCIVMQECSGFLNPDTPIVHVKFLSKDVSKYPKYIIRKYLSFLGLYSLIDSRI